MGNQQKAPPKKDMNDIILEMKMTSKRFTREANKAEKECNI